MEYASFALLVAVFGGILPSLNFYTETIHYIISFIINAIIALVVCFLLGDSIDSVIVFMIVVVIFAWVNSIFVSFIDQEVPLGIIITIVYTIALFLTLAIGKDVEEKSQEYSNNKVELVESNFINTKTKGGVFI